MYIYVCVCACFFKYAFVRWKLILFFWVQGGPWSDTHFPLRWTHAQSVSFHWSCGKKKKKDRFFFCFCFCFCFLRKNCFPLHTQAVCASACQCYQLSGGSQSGVWASEFGSCTHTLAHTHSLACTLSRSNSLIFHFIFLQGTRGVGCARRMRFQALRVYSGCDGVCKNVCRIILLLFLNSSLLPTLFRQAWTALSRP